MMNVRLIVYIMEKEIIFYLIKIHDLTFTPPRIEVMIQNIGTSRLER